MGLAKEGKILYNADMKVAIFGGSFDPVHSEHVRLVRAAIEELGLNKVLVMPAYRAPHKSGSRASGKDRLEMLRLAFSGIPEAEISDFELNADRISYSYLTCQWFKERYPEAERYFLMGADMLADFFAWYRPEEILNCVTLVACGRGKQLSGEMEKRFFERFHKTFLTLSFVGEQVSSTRLYVSLNFRTKTEVCCLEALDPAVLSYISERGLYYYPEQIGALDLEKEERRAHSYRVALMACMRCRSVGVPEEKALLAAMLHDCGKYVDHIEGFLPPENVPSAVLHQYRGAYLAEHRFGVSDPEILEAIRCHTSGRENMTTLDKLLYLSDLLEEGRTFQGVETLRALFWKDLDECLLQSLREQLKYLKGTEKPVFPLTEQAYRWISAFQNAKK